MALTEDRIEYRVVIDGDMIHDLSQTFPTASAAAVYMYKQDIAGHDVEVKKRHVITQYQSWE